MSTPLMASEGLLRSCLKKILCPFNFLSNAVSHALERERRDPMIEFLLNENTRYSDSFWPDFGFYLRQQHTLLALCSSHRLHPYSKFFRFVVVIANLSFSFCASGVVGYLDHTRSPWYIPASYIISPIVIFLLTSILRTLAVCGMVQRDGTRRVFRWAGLGMARLLFLICWAALVPSCVFLGLLFASFHSTKDAIEERFSDVPKDFRPSWHVFVAEWWLQIVVIVWIAEFPLWFLSFIYVRRQEEGECLVTQRIKWEKGEGLQQSNPLLQSSGSDSDGPESPA